MRFIKRTLLLIMKNSEEYMKRSLLKNNIPFEKSAIHLTEKNKISKTWQHSSRHWSCGSDIYNAGSFYLKALFNVSVEKLNLVRVTEKLLRVEYKYIWTNILKMPCNLKELLKCVLLWIALVGFWNKSTTTCFALFR